MKGKKGNIKGKKGAKGKEKKEPTVMDEKGLKEFPEVINFGKFEFKSKIIYIGSYKQLKSGIKVREGFGKVIHQSTQDNLGEEYYEGEWKNDMMNGYGIYHYSNGDIYEGDWVNNMQCGYGKYIFSDGMRYEGEWKDHKMHGTGKYLDLNNIGWGGEFRDGCYFSKDQLKLKEEKRLLKKMAKIKEIPIQFFKQWEEVADNVDKKNTDDMLSPFFAKVETMGKFFKNITFPEYEDYLPEYWNDTIRWVFGQKPRALGENAANKNASKSKKKKGDKKSAKDVKPDTNNISVVKDSNKDSIENKDDNNNDNNGDFPKPKYEVNVPKNGNDLIFLNKDCLEVPQLQEELSSGQVIEVRSTLDERIVCIAIGFKRDVNKWYIIYFNDNKAPEKQEKKTKAKSKAKSKGKKKK